MHLREILNHIVNRIRAIQNSDLSDTTIIKVFGPPGLAFVAMAVEEEGVNADNYHSLGGRRFVHLESSSLVERCDFVVLFVHGNIKDNEHRPAVYYGAAEQEYILAAEHIFEYLKNGNFPSPPN